MSNEGVDQKVLDLLKTAGVEAAKGATAQIMKDLPSLVQKEMEGLPAIVRKEMDACLDGKCDAIAERLVEKLPKAEASTLKVEDVTKAVKEAMEGSTTPFNVEGHSAHDILDCPTCKPILVKKLWENPEYRQNVMEKICEDDTCRESMTKMFKDKGVGVEENVGEEESWAERRLRERRE